MSEIIPRWGMPEVDFLETEPEKILESIISLYEEKPAELWLRQIRSDCF